MCILNLHRECVCNPLSVSVCVDWSRLHAACGGCSGAQCGGGSTKPLLLPQPRCVCVNPHRSNKGQNALGFPWFNPAAVSHPSLVHISCCVAGHSALAEISLNALCVCVSTLLYWIQLRSSKLRHTDWLVLI